MRAAVDERAQFVQSHMHKRDREQESSANEGEVISDDKGVVVIEKEDQELKKDGGNPRRKKANVLVIKRELILNR